MYAPLETSMPGGVTFPRTSSLCGLLDNIMSNETKHDWIAPLETSMPGGVTPRRMSSLHGSQGKIADKDG